MCLIKRFISALIKVIQDTDYSPAEKVKRFSYLNALNLVGDLQPTQESSPSIDIMYLVQDALKSIARFRYGEFDGKKVFKRPIYCSDDPCSNSRIIAFHGELDVGIKIGPEFNTWERAFYQIAHEVIHLLNPVLAPTGTIISASSLDEGVAVKFAEEMYSKYIAEYKKLPFGDSPIGMNTKYWSAYKVVAKIPDQVLRGIRSDAGGFPFASDSKTILAHAAEFISVDEAEFIVSNFQ